MGLPDGLQPDEQRRIKLNKADSIKNRSGLNKVELEIEDSIEWWTKVGRR